MNDDAIWSRREVESPCVRVCVIHPPSGLCMGCYRTIAEISDWSKMEPEARRALMADLPNREDRIKGTRRGGRTRGASSKRGN
ncbi:DUF1289 domain-containing protein [Oceanomicrobium pacificus]|uniref:DUF1289 domain-containing protein n=1 Tax=Oceanomicrobium pacificus TaxID=2692916 RepID=A0A6B0TWS3_9RHOB|nr:DUF1289 domain-containing protein [Oceanomicrobium pacificus]MXU65463.1 DUF1289 domain-containing protein [Oceanomicrobium pacificus]